MRDDAWSESYVATQITSCGKLVGFIWTKLVPRTCPPEKSVHLETVAFRESRPVALPNPSSPCYSLREIVSGLVHSASEGSCPRHQFSSFERSNRDHMLCLCWFGSRDYGTIGPLSSCYADSAAHVQFSEVQRNDRLTTVRPIVGKFEGIVFT